MADRGGERVSRVSFPKEWRSWTGGLLHTVKGNEDGRFRQ